VDEIRTSISLLRGQAPYVSFSGSIHIAGHSQSLRPCESVSSVSLESDSPARELGLDLDATVANTLLP
jgi:hypothetical protein